MIAISKSTTTRMRATPRAVFTVLIVGLSVWTLSAQTEIKLPKNKFTPQQDVQLGREGAAEVRKQYPAIDDPAIQKYLSALGDRLVLAEPPALKESV